MHEGTQGSLGALARCVVAAILAVLALAFVRAFYLRPATDTHCERIHCRYKQTKKTPVKRKELGRSHTGSTRSIS